jgi:hypothetical protein
MYKFLAFICNLSGALGVGALLAMLTSSFAPVDIALFLGANMRLAISFALCCFVLFLVTGHLALNAKNDAGF